MLWLSLICKRQLVKEYFHCQRVLAKRVHELGHALHGQFLRIVGSQIAVHSLKFRWKVREVIYGLEVPHCAAECMRMVSETKVLV